MDPERVAIDQGPVVLMIENYRSEFSWQAMRENEYLVRGLSAAGFKGGWLSSTKSVKVRAARVKTRRNAS